MIGVNLRGCFAARRPARANASGRGAARSSTSDPKPVSQITHGQDAHYHASKAAIAHLTTVLAFELGSLRIR